MLNETLAYCVDSPPPPPPLSPSSSSSSSSSSSFPSSSPSPSPHPFTHTHVCRVCIRPEVSRTKTFGKIGVSSGLYYTQHLQYIVLNSNAVDFSKKNLSYLLEVCLSHDLQHPLVTSHDLFTPPGSIPEGVCLSGVGTAYCGRG